MGYLIPIPLLILIICFFVDANDASFLFNNCFDDPQAASYSKVSLNDVVLELLKNAPSNKGFWNASRGEGSANQVYGLASCRGDLSPLECRQCLSPVAQYIIDYHFEDCGAKGGQFIVADACSIKVSSTNFFGTLDYDVDGTGTGVYYRAGTGHAKSENFTDVVTGFMNDMADHAAANQTSYFAHDQKYDRGEGVTMYGMCQCTRDLPTDTDRCRVCLGLVISRLSECCTPTLGGTVVSGSCLVRIEINPFLNI